MAAPLARAYNYSIAGQIRLLWRPWLRILSLQRSHKFDISRNMNENNVIAALSALAQETRLRLFRLLIAVGAEGLPAGRIAEELGAAESTLSFHLSHLRQAGLIQRRRDGRLIYSADFATMTALVVLLCSIFAGGRPWRPCPLSPSL